MPAKLRELAKSAFDKWIKQAYTNCDVNNRLYMPEDMRAAFNAGYRAGLKDQRGY